MEISDQELRTLVRESIARHGRSPGAVHEPVSFALTPMGASHGRFPVPGGSEDDGQCLIEPAVGCNHCGYCQSLGH